jgi:hypothetical protein
VLYEDPELGFCVLAHSYKGAKDSPPHDHGPSWAIYGQAAGETEMTDYALVAKPADGKPGQARPVRTYKLLPAWRTSTTKATCIRRGGAAPRSSSASRA